MERRNILVEALSQANFFSNQADSSTDSAHIADELFLAVYLDHSAIDKRVHVRNPFFTVRKLECGNAQGLLASLERAMIHVGVSSDWKKKRTGFGCDGASVNIVNRGLKGLLRESAPWVQFVWCLAHRLELALKYALKDTVFMLVDEMLM